MKQLWKTYGLAAVVTLLILGCLIWLGSSLAASAVSSRYYAKWIVDDAKILSAQTEESLAETIRQMDEKYGSILGIVTTDEEIANVADYAFALQRSHGFGKQDMMLLIAPVQKTHYLADGDVIAHYFPNDLRLAMAEVLTPDSFSDESADDTVLAAYALAENWYEDHISVQMGGRKDRSQPAGGAEVLMTLLLVTVSLFALLCLFRYFVYPLFRHKSLGAWKPLWGKHILGPLHKEKNDR